MGAECDSDGAKLHIQPCGAIKIEEDQPIMAVIEIGSDSVLIGLIWFLRRIS